ncbi:MFS transporter [Saccharopolyspora hordei]|uniref:Putative proline/betaine transporter n=1 Tax=Saccharopolyspora hordei TaxID=1838 RepID=A0A853AMW4_9PSEU|nr:MFS transporter [Saccharopolyspora hordei]NYI85176.1 MHS family alpha-ketoglutarate permease-like MFS transporter [Saccharopolyspora hordei]
MSGSTEPRRPTHVRAVLSGAIGNTVEWYDWFVYANFALYFAGRFFPEGDATAQLMNTAAVFAVGFLARPLGGWVLGRIADRRGRKFGLTLSVTMMSISALLIAIAPDHEQAGYLGAVLLLLARIMQGLSVGGEYAASAAYLTEVSRRGRRGLGSSFQYVSVTIGQLLGLVVLMVLQSTLTEQQLTAWGWRIPFVIGAIAALVVFYLRRRMHETAAYAEEERHDSEQRRGTLREVWRHRRAAGLVFALTLGGSVAFYTYTTYLTKYLANSVGLSKSDAALVMFLALCLFTVLLPIGGAISDKVGRRPVLVFFGVGTTLGTYPIMTAMQRWPGFGVALALTALALTIVAGYSSVNACVKAELFPTGIRTVGVAIPYALAQALFGGTAEYVALAFRDAGVEHWFFFYVSACGLVSLLTYLLMPETRTAALSRAEQPSVPGKESAW